MTKQAKQAEMFHALHQPGNPIVLFNVWDAGSAKAAAAAGAKAIATGSASVAGALGFSDGEAVPFELVLQNAARISAAVDVPFSLDFEGGYAVAPDALADNFARVIAAGAIGCNFEDQIIGGAGLHPLHEQVKRIKAMRAAASRLGVAAFINARTDIFLKSPPADHSAAMVDDAIARGRAYADAGASGLFLPGLADDGLIARACAASPLPVNIMVMAHTPSKARLTELGVQRISHGPGPWTRAMKALADATRAAMA